ncbi:hypothetical protein [Agaribacterium sp. ZY112]|uniref:hypothetical protein n=1 Tax=Agaribacterium sp. ZY112 TaxID=3233574 RepID=UPI0035240D7E
MIDVNPTNLRSKIALVLQDLESSGDIVITTALPNLVVDKLLSSIGGDALSLLGDDEFYAVLSTINALIHGVQLNEHDFPNVIGLSKEEMRSVQKKLIELRGNN